MTVLKINTLCFNDLGCLMGKVKDDRIHFNLPTTRKGIDYLTNTDANVHTRDVAKCGQTSNSCKEEVAGRCPGRKAGAYALHGVSQSGAVRYFQCIARFRPT